MNLQTTDEHHNQVISSPSNSLPSRSDNGGTTQSLALGQFAIVGGDCGRR